MKIYIPMALDRRRFNAQFKGKLNDQALFVIDQVIKLQCQKRDDYDQENGWVSLCSKIMEEFGVRDFHSIRKNLIELGVLVQLPYKEGSCRKFRFGKTFRDGFRCIDAPDSRFWYSVKRRINAYYKKPGANYALVKYFNEKLTIDKKAAIEWTVNHYLELEELDSEKAANFIMPTIVSIDRIVRGDFFYTVDKNGRLHTNLTNLKKELRQFLRYDGKKLVEIDFVNCQPMLLSYLLEPAFWNSKSAINYRRLKGLKYDDYRNWKPKVVQIPLKRQKIEVKRWNYSNSKESFGIPYIYRGSNNHVVSLLIFSNNRITLDTPDIQRYKNATRDGEFYEYFMTASKSELSRSEVKVMMYEVLFGKPTTGRKRLSKNKRMFKEAFPTVQRLIDHIKSSDHATLANMLQSIEARLMFRFVVPRLMEIGTEPIFTIHDSVLVPMEYAEKATSIVEKKTLEVLGFFAKIK